jgi:hypothetical protein
MNAKQNRLRLEGDWLCTAIRKATLRSKEPILCLVKPNTIRFVALSGLRLVVSWETALDKPVSGRLAFVIPPLIAQLLSSEVIQGQTGVEIAVKGGDVVVRLSDALGRYEIRWQSDLSAFPAPTEFSELIGMPGELMEVPYIRLTDATHEAVAKLVHMEADEEVHRSKLAILIDLDFGRLSIDGQEIIGTGSTRYYFDPRLVIRALEFIKARTLRVGVRPLKAGNRAYLAMLAKQQEWTVQCSLLSIGKETQMLYPLPPGRDR